MNRAKLLPVVASVALCAGAAGALTYATVLDHSPTALEKKARKGRLFPSFRKAMTSRIVLTLGAERIELEKQASGSDPWIMHGSETVTGDVGAIEELLTNLDTAEPVRRVDGPPSTLGAVRATGDIRMNAVTAHYALGDATTLPTGGAYLAIDGAGLFVISKSLAEMLLRPLDSYRDKALIPFSPEQISEITLLRTSYVPPSKCYCGKNGGHRTEQRQLARMDATHFRFRYSQTGYSASERAERVVRRSMDDIFGTLANVRAERFVPWAARAEIAKVKITSASGGTAEIQLFSAPECAGLDGVSRTMAGLPPVSACVDPRAWQGMENAIAAIGKEPFIDDHADEVSEFSIESTTGDGVRLALARKGSGWHARAPEDRDLTGAESKLGDAALVELLGLRTVQFPISENPAWHPFRTVVLYSGEPSAKRILTVREGDQSLYVSSSDDPANWYQIYRDPKTLLVPVEIVKHP